MKYSDLLAFEHSWLNRPQHSGAKEQAILEVFGVSSTRYYQALNAVLDTREALELDPVTVGIVKRRRAARQHQRRPVG